MAKAACWPTTCLDICGGMGALILDADLRRSITERAYAEVLAGYHLGPMGDKLVELLTPCARLPARSGAGAVDRRGLTKTFRKLGL